MFVPNIHTRPIPIGATLAATILAVFVVGCAAESESESVAESVVDTNKPVATVKVVVAAKTKGLTYYPCDQCHRPGGAADAVAKGVGPGRHAHAFIRLKHMPNAQCQTCHDVTDPGQLRLAAGLTFALEQTEKLCAQCHSGQVADWQVGIHGKQLGNWQTEIHRYGCTQCHDPHHPRFGTMRALPPPAFPRLGIPKGNHP